MESPVVLLLCFSFSVVTVSTQDMFLVTAPSVFHVGVKERVSVQLPSSLLNQPVLLYLEHETSGLLMSNRATFQMTQEKQIGVVELEVDREKMSSLPTLNPTPFYLALVCEIRPGQREMVRVLVSQHRGYIFIQTDQPVYTPTQTVKYRIFTLDHSMRPHAEPISISVFNAGGNRVTSWTVREADGIYSRKLNIPDVSEPGVWRIVAHYQGDEKNAATREFQVKKFVMPSFDVSIKPEQNYFLVTTEKFHFTIHASYSYGETIKGAYHCRFGVRQEATGDADTRKPETIIIRGLEKSGSVNNGEAEVTLFRLQIENLLKERSANLTQLALDRTQLYVAVTVIDIASGELQEAEVFIPIVSQRFSVDLSRTRSYFIPGVPFHVSAVVHLPDGSPAANVPVDVHVTGSSAKPQSVQTNGEGAAHLVFNNIPNDRPVTVKVTVDNHPSEKTVFPSLSSSNNYLYIDVSSKVVSPGEEVIVNFNVVGSSLAGNQIYYLVLSKGVLRAQNSEPSGPLVQIRLPVSSDLIPSFRLIGYYYDQTGDIIADSVWVDVEDVCEGKILLSAKEEHIPGKLAKLDINLEGQKAKVALLAVDTAIYALNVHNRLTPKQVFASMQSYDLGCSYGGGSDTANVFNDAGLSFISHSKTVKSRMRIGFGCESGFRRQKRSLDLQQLMNSKVFSYVSKELQQCCRDGLTLIPMQLTCEERAKRVSRRGKGQDCTNVFLDCCREGIKLRDLKRQEEAKKQHGRTHGITDMEDFFDSSTVNIRRHFPPSFAFEEIQVDGSRRHDLFLPDSITTWEIQAVSVSASHGICVAQPCKLMAKKTVFVSLRLPYSVKRFEQLSIVAVVYNYGDETKQLSVHMKRVDGLCSPGSASMLSHVNVNVSRGSPQTVTFPAVPMITGKIPVTLLIYDTEEKLGLDAIEKELLVMTEGVVKREEKTHFIDLDGRNRQNFLIDGQFPNSTIPDSDTNLFVMMEGGVFDKAKVLPLLSPSGVNGLLRAPMGCAEQTMIRLSPTALALHYLDHTQGWMDLPAGARDVALSHVEGGYSRILTFKKNDASYGAWLDRPSSIWLTAQVVKVLSLVADRQLEGRGEKGRQGANVVSVEEISQSVEYLISKQSEEDGSFNDPHPVIHREMQGGVGGTEGDVSLTAFVTIALKRSLHHLTGETKNKAEDSVSRATAYIESRFSSLERPYAVAIAAYCLSVCQNDKTLAKSAWSRLKELATKEGNCRMWRSKADMRLPGEVKHYAVPPPEAITVETTAYALLTAVANGELEWADSAACWLSEKENYGGGFRSTQDTIVALEALSHLVISRPTQTPPTITAQFNAPGKSQKENLNLGQKEQKVETELKRLLGNNINVEVTGKGKAKLKVVKAFHVLEPNKGCELLSIKVTVEGKVKYTAEVIENYDYDYYGAGGEGEDKRDEEEKSIPHSEIEWFDARSRHRRETEQTDGSSVKYTVCVSHSPSRNLSGMAIADITMLSGFEAQRDDLDKLKALSDQYISHYETEYGRVILYFNEIQPEEQCIGFSAVQKVPVGLVQPAPATFYDYYEPDRRCSIFYAAPLKSKMVSTLCSGEVCQCAERPCYTEKKTVQMKIKKKDRFEFACYHPTVDYGYKVEVYNISIMSGFELYQAKVKDVLRATADDRIMLGSVRVFAKRLHCKGQLELGKSFLIMGKDGSTTDSYGQMQYLLDSETWVEKLPTDSKCQATPNKLFCRGLDNFMSEYQKEGCRQ
ncbi:complement C4-B [Scleropages formosus]|uniref:complement C4-B n=1 Tax=Scleropages formosus TaxID=113540 RepID=UPI0010FA8B5A|nr:complement C4-like [Scleropages formosus]